MTGKQVGSFSNRNISDSDNELAFCSRPYVDGGWRANSPPTKLISSKFIVADPSLRADRNRGKSNVLIPECRTTIRLMGWPVQRQDKIRSRSSDVSFSSGVPLTARLEILQRRHDKKSHKAGSKLKISGSNRCWCRCSSDRIGLSQ